MKYSIDNDSIIDIDPLEKLRKMKDEFAALTGKFSQAYKDVAIDIAEAEIQEAVTVLRRSNRPKTPHDGVERFR